MVRSKEGGAVIGCMVASCSQIVAASFVVVFAVWCAVMFARAFAVWVMIVDGCMIAR